MVAADGLLAFTGVQGGESGSRNGELDKALGAALATHNKSLADVTIAPGRGLQAMTRRLWDLSPRERLDHVTVVVGLDAVMGAPTRPAPKPGQVELSPITPPCAAGVPSAATRGRA